MSLRTEIRYSTGIGMEEYLAEGIRFFRNSKRIEKLIKKFNDSISFAKEPDVKRDVLNHIRELEKAKMDFQSVEEQFASGDKENALETYRQLRVKFADIIVQINKDSIKKFLFGTGLAVLMFAIFSSIVPSQTPIQSANIATNAMPNMSTLKHEESDILKEIRENNKELKSVRDQKKWLGLFDKNQHLMDRLAKEQQRLQHKM